MIKKRMMLVGPGRSGKSTLANVINRTHRPIRRTQDIIYGTYTIDTPSVYLEMPFNYSFLVAASQEANVLICVVDATAGHSVYPPRFASSFNCVKVGVITKVDLATEEQMIYARKQMKELGIEEPPLEMNVLECMDHWEHPQVLALDAFKKYCKL